MYAAAVRATQQHLVYAGPCAKCQELMRQLAAWRERDWMKKVRGEHVHRMRSQRGAVPVNTRNTWLGAPLVLKDEAEADEREESLFASMKQDPRGGPYRTLPVRGPSSFKGGSLCAPR